MKLISRPLHGRFVRLEPLAADYKEDLRDACDADPEIWELFSNSRAGEHFNPWWDRVVNGGGDPPWLLFAAYLGGRCVGVTGFAPERAAGVAMIGATYFRPEARGGPANAESKRLLLAHAFESGARRVSFNVDVLNKRSRAAMTKLGAVQEGILRQASITWKGRARDEVVFSILADEWPSVRERLDVRLDRFAAFAAR